MIDKKTIQHTARLARIRLTDKEEEKFQGDLSSVLDYIEQLNKVNTEGVEPLYQTTGIINSVREDEDRGEFKVGEKNNSLLVGQAPEKQENFVKVKPVFKNNE